MRKAMSAVAAPAATLLGQTLRLAMALATSAVAAGAALAADSHLAADGYLILAPGEQALIHIDAARHVVVDQLGPIQPDAGKAGDSLADHLLVTFSTSGPMPGTSLVVRNGYANGFNYQARMRIGARVAPTSVCGLIPQGAGYENWADVLSGIEIGDFTAADAGALHC
jgi:hypothetical protein